MIIVKTQLWRGPPSRIDSRKIRFWQVNGLIQLKSLIHLKISDILKSPLFSDFSQEKRNPSRTSCPSMLRAHSLSRHKPRSPGGRPRRAQLPGPQTCPSVSLPARTALSQTRNPKQPSPERHSWFPAQSPTTRSPLLSCTHSRPCTFLADPRILSARWPCGRGSPGPQWPAQPPAPSSGAQVLHRACRQDSSFRTALENQEARKSPDHLVLVPSRPACPWGACPTDRPSVLRKPHRKEQKIKAITGPVLPEDTVTEVPWPQ